MNSRYYRLCSFLVSSHNNCFIYSKCLIHQASALVFSDILLLSSSDSHMIQMMQLIKHIDDVANENYLKSAPETYFFASPCKKPWSKKLKLTQSDQFIQFSAVHKILSSASKIELMRFIVAINFFSKIEDNR